jgi:hypothetical protein
MLELEVMQRSLALVVTSLLVTACSVSEGPAAAPSTPAPGGETAEQPVDPVPSRDVPPGYEAALKNVIKEIDGRTGLGPDLKVDTAKLEADALGLLETGGDDVDAGFHLGLHAILAVYPVGHLGVGPRDAKGCTRDMPYASTSVVAACTQPYGDHAVVTIVRPSNPLGLVAGDEILAIDDAAGQAMLDATLARPTCVNTGIASASNRRARAGTSVFAGVRVGTKVTIKHVDGTTETKTVEQVSTPVDCRDPFGRRGKYIAKATTGECQSRCRLFMMTYEVVASVIVS